MKETRKVWYLHKMSSSKEDKQVYGANLEGNGEKFLMAFKLSYPTSPAGESPEYLGFMVCKVGRRPFTVLTGVVAACQVGAPCL